MVMETLNSRMVQVQWPITKRGISSKNQLSAPSSAIETLSWYPHKVRLCPDGHVLLAINSSFILKGLAVACYKAWFEIKCLLLNTHV